MGDGDRARVRRALLEYVHAHAEASDTEVGIAGWWLPAGTHVPFGVLGEVLRELVAEGVLAVTVLPDGSELFGVKKHGGDQP